MQERTLSVICYILLLTVTCGITQLPSTTRMKLEYYTSPVHWNAANNHCKSLGSRLLQYGNSRIVNYSTYLTQALLQLSFASKLSAWIGIVIKNSSVVWMDGCSEVCYDGWADSQPASMNTNFCVSLYFSESSDASKTRSLVPKWVTRKCDNDQSGFICEYSSGEPCDYTLNSGKKLAPSADTESEVFSEVTDRECQQYCDSRIKSDKECWGFNYVKEHSSCELLYTIGPFELVNNIHKSEGYLSKIRTCFERGNAEWFSSPAFTGGDYVPDSEIGGFPIAQTNSELESVQVVWEAGKISTTVDPSPDPHTPCFENLNMTACSENGTTGLSSTANYNRIHTVDNGLTQSPASSFVLSKSRKETTTPMGKQTMSSSPPSTYDTDELFGGSTKADDKTETTMGSIFNHGISISTTSTLSTFSSEPSGETSSIKQTRLLTAETTSFSNTETGRTLSGSTQMGKTPSLTSHELSDKMTAFLTTESEETPGTISSISTTSALSTFSSEPSGETLSIKQITLFTAETTSFSNTETGKTLSGSTQMGKTPSLTSHELSDKMTPFLKTELMETQGTTSFIPGTSATITTDVCVCWCESSNLKQNLTRDEFIKKLIEELEIDKQNLSSSVRKKISVYESRTVSMTLGVVWIGILIGIYGAVFLSDVIVGGMISGAKWKANKLKKIKLDKDTEKQCEKD